MSHSRPSPWAGSPSQRRGVSFSRPSPNTRSSGFLTPLTGGPSRCADATQHSGKGHATRQPHNPGNADACAPVPQNRLAAPRPPLHSLEVQGSRGQPPTHPVAMLHRPLMRCAVPLPVAALRPMAGVGEIEHWHTVSLGDSLRVCGKPSYERTSTVAGCPNRTQGAGCGPAQQAQRATAGTVGCEQVPTVRRGFYGAD